MRYCLIPLIACLGVFAEEQSPGGTPPCPTVCPAPQDAPPATPEQEEQKRRDSMKKMQELSRKISELQGDVYKDPEVVKLREAADAAQKACRDKIDSLSAAKPGYTELKAQMDALRKEMGMGPRPRGMGPNGPHGPNPRMPPGPHMAPPEAPKP